jgi:multifunctional methyltransferase subunit TRM112
MRLLTHNFLQSNVKGTEKGYPLLIEGQVVVVDESPMDKDLLLKLIPKLDYAVLRGAIEQVASSAGHQGGVELPQLPTALPERSEQDGDWHDDDFLAKLHTAIMDVHVMEGNLVCPDTGRKFPIKEGIPNMILHEDEI